MNNQDQLDLSKVNYPQCKMNPSMRPTITYNKYFLPCCFLNTFNTWDDLVELLGDHIEDLNVTKYSINDINKSKAFELIEKSFTENPMSRCLMKCNKPIPKLSQTVHGMDRIEIKSVEGPQHAY